MFQNVETNKVALLNDEEMKETKGEFVGALVVALLTPVAVESGKWLSNGLFHKWF